MPGCRPCVVADVPKEKIGIVVLTNRSGARTARRPALEIVDRLMGLPSANMVARYAELEAKALAGEEAAKSAGVSDRGRHEARPQLATYAADYEHPATAPSGGGGGRAAAADLQRLHVAAGPLALRGVPRPRRPREPPGADARAFETDLEGEVSTLDVPLEPNVPPTVFTRKAPAEMTTRAFLEPLTGVYEVNGIDAEVALREDGVLLYVVLGRPRELVPCGARSSASRTSRASRSSS